MEIEESVERESELEWTSYSVQRETWPKSGQYIMAQYSDDSVVVYQAFNAEIADYAVKNQKFDGNPAYNETRMTWIKTNFLWMMYRCGWAQKVNQDRVLAIWLKRELFEKILGGALGIKNNPKSEEGGAHAKPWRVQVQWDPDHYPNGDPHLGRRAIQLGIKGIEAFKSGDGLIRIEDITDRVLQQLPFVKSGKYDQLMTPRESIYPVPSHLKAILTVENNQKKNKSNKKK
eukprot:TRINITY_DN2722_c0_g1_i1.p1 TRINITY_DN2722_c0_g1~~TRINITY_DN2722_c0_g1_i1.p1  ORF type:complete len:231 (+),score=62.25 TRINITY_DN2722_c0_g1_i1:85-777(+)